MQRTQAATKLRSRHKRPPKPIREARISNPISIFLQLILLRQMHFYSPTLALLSIEPELPSDHSHAILLCSQTFPCFTPLPHPRFPFPSLPPSPLPRFLPLLARHFQLASFHDHCFLSHFHQPSFPSGSCESDPAFRPRPTVKANHYQPLQFSPNSQSFQEQTPTSSNPLNLPFTFFHLRLSISIISPTLIP